MNLIFSIIALVVGVSIWGVLIYKAAGLVPFAQKNMADRRERIAGALQASEASQKQLAEVQDQIARDLAEAKKQADDIMARAKKEAADEAAEIRARGERDSVAILERAKSDIAAERDAAINEIRREVATVVVDASGAVLGEALDATSHRRLIDESLAKVSPEEVR